MVRSYVLGKVTISGGNAQDFFEEELAYQKTRIGRILDGREGKVATSFKGWAGRVISGLESAVKDISNVQVNNIPIGGLGCSIVNHGEDYVLTLTASEDMSPDEIGRKTGILTSKLLKYGFNLNLQIPIAEENQ